MLPQYEADSVEVPFVIQHTQEHVTQDTFWAEHSHPTHELLWHERGASTATVGSRRWTITRSMGLWIPAGAPHSGWMPAGTWYRAAQFSVRSAPSLGDDAAAIELTPLLRLLLDRLSDPTLSDHSRTLTEALVFDLMHPAATQLLLRLPQSALLAPIVQSCQDSPRSMPTLGQWSRDLGVSSRTITRTFVAETGLGFSQWVTAAKAQFAVGPLTRGESLEEVAEAVGFSSSSAFSTAFKRVTGMSPGRFRTIDGH